MPEYTYETFFLDELNSRYWLRQPKKLSYILSRHPIKTYKMKQVQDRSEGKGRVLLPAHIQTATSRKHSKLHIWKWLVLLAELPGGLLPPPVNWQSYSMLFLAPTSQNNLMGPMCAVKSIKQVDWWGQVPDGGIHKLSWLMAPIAPRFPKSQWRPVKIRLTWWWKSDYPVFCQHPWKRSS